MPCYLARVYSAFEAATLRVMSPSTSVISQPLYFTSLKVCHSDSLLAMTSRDDFILRVIIHLELLHIFRDLAGQYRDNWTIRASLGKSLDVQ